MATATARPYDNEIKLGAPQVFALKFVTGKPVASRFPGGRVMFTAVDERKIFLNDEEASEFEHAMLDKRIQPGDFVCVTRVSHTRGGGYSIRVERVEDKEEPGTLAAPRIPPAREEARTVPTRQEARAAVPTREEALLEKSVEMARASGPGAFIAPKPEQQQPVSAAAVAMVAAMCAAVDAVYETQAYAQRRGLGVTFSEESVRAIGLSIYIGNQRVQR